MRQAKGMYHTIENMLQSANIPRFNEKDPTLSGGEQALAAITSVLVEHWDRLDADQQRVLVEVLDNSTRASEDATARLRALFVEQG